MSANDNEPKMAQFLDRLTHREQQIICHQVRTHSGEQRYAHLHPGLLPFVPLLVVLQALQLTKAVRPVAVIISKLPKGNFISWDRITLCDAKVIRMFGKRPQDGRPINWLPNKPIVALSREQGSTAGDGFSVWKIQIANRHRPAVVQWLHDICG